MASLINILLTVFDPLGIARKFLLRPLWEIANVVFNQYKEKTKASFNSMQSMFLRFGILMLALIVILWTAVFMYLTFYMTFMPVVSHIRPVHLQFKQCDDSAGVCSFPSAHVSLTKKQQLLMVGQPYKVLVHIDMPESPKNQNLGMFMVCAEMRDQQTNLRGHSCRSVVLRYKSQLLQSITTWLLAPIMILGFREERQHIPIELFSNYEDDQSHPVTEVYIEIQSRHVEFYGVQLHVTAHFTGLRYIMFHWPILSACVGISTNLFFILIVCLLSWYHWSDKEWLDEAKEKYNSFRSKASLDFGGRSDAETVTKSVDGDPNLLLDEELSNIEDISGGSFDDNSVRQRK